MNVLLIETATQICSVVLAAEGKVLARRESDTPNAHSTCLSVFIDEVLTESHLTPRDLGAVCVSAGPGSYTGLRIGVSTAKGFCYALGIPLLSVPTLLSMASLYYHQHPDYNGLVCPMIDARRMECYTMIVDSSKNILRDTSADVIEQGFFDEWLDRGEVTFIGDGAEKTKEILGTHPNYRYDNDFHLSAEGMIELAFNQLREGKTEDVAYFEPFYLKDFVAKKSVVHGLR
ncbi:MAG: tRNA (adenosine(37)-N6)-threonylcarbamoyltransferase complex dimerization subunit type 1 TsaB [Bacteroidales bacterium]|nr:tRNA (adenosine(37)-N6)-threonylcarbamoyltransferase complex dimerization subunit type 1 TsaB [Bacteroidales bacterium]